MPCPLTWCAWPAPPWPSLQGPWLAVAVAAQLMQQQRQSRWSPSSLPPQWATPAQAWRVASVQQSTLPVGTWRWPGAPCLCALSAAPLPLPLTAAAATPPQPPPQPPLQCGLCPGPTPSGTQQPWPQWWLPCRPGLRHFSRAAATPLWLACRLSAPQCPLLQLPRSSMQQRAPGWQQRTGSQSCSRQQRCCQRC